MSDNFDFDELEEILRRVREQQGKTAENVESEPEPSDAFAPVEPPKPRVESAPVEPPKEEKKPQVKKQKVKKKKPLKPSGAIIRANVKTRLLPAVKSALGKVFTKRLGIAVLAVAVIAGVVFGGIKLYDYSKVAYLKPYVEKYGIDYPEGIRKEFCDAYGKDQRTAGTLIFDDNGKEIPVGGKSKKDLGVMELGSTVLEEQHLRSVALYNSALEQYYCTAKAYKSSSQHVVFKTLFDDEEYQVVAAYYANTNAKNDNGYVFPYNAWGNLTERSFKSYIDRVNTRSLYITGAKLDYEGYYLSVNMPTEKQPDSRFVLLCKRIERKRDFEKITKTKANKRIRHTQAWYDEHKQQNPYRLASNWYPQIYTDTTETKTRQLTEKDF
ncbi:MAG: hypothetical protein IJ872_02010 [Eubacterium sp.]|nr:hypothetical protein [Eubacterium sp.]